MTSEESRAPVDAERRVEDLYRTLVESVRDYAIFILDPEGRIVSWNPGAELIKGYTADEIIGEHYRVFYPESARAAGDPEVQLEIAAREGRFEGEGWRIRKDGGRFWASVVVTALFDGDELVGFGKVTDDRTAEQEAQQKLLVRERQLQEAQEIAHLGSWEYDLDTDEVAWSDELFRIFGLPPGSAVRYEDYLQRLAPDDREAVRAKVAKSLDTGRPYIHEHRIRRPDGEVRWVQSRGEVDRDAAGRPVRLVGTTIDITEIKEAEARARRLAGERAARREAERAAQRMVFLAEASALLGTSLDYRDTLSTVAQLAVPSFADLCAVDMIRPDDRLHRLAIAHLDPERVRLAEEIHDAYPSDFDADHGVHAIIRDGEPRIFERITSAALDAVAEDPRHRQLLEELGPESAIIAPIRVRGRPLGAISFVYAESGRRYGQDDLVIARELAGRAALAIENAQLHSAEREARARAERASERTARLQTITGRLSEAVTPERVAAVVVEEGVPALEADSGALVLGRPDGRLEMVESVGVPEHVREAFAAFDLDTELPLAEAIREDRLVVVEDVTEQAARYPALAEALGEMGTRAMVVVPLRSGTGVIGSLGVGYGRARTFSEDDRGLLEALARQCAQALERAWLFETEHQAREAAEAASRAKSQFVAMMSHELRTPLSAIIGYQELLAEEIHGPINDDQRQHLQRIRSSATHLRDLINQILSLSRLEAEREDIERVDTDLVEVARESALLMEREVESKGLELEFRLPGEPARAATDPGKVRQILLNLLSNAVKFTDQGTLRVGVDADESEVRLTIEDTGTGIAEEDRERIFDVFTQVDQSMTRSAGGSGLGLAVSRRLARMLGGDLEMESEVGVGSTFVLRIPKQRT